MLRFRRYSVPGNVSLSAVLPRERPRCGIYILRFRDGRCYVGQSVDVLARFSTHRRRWGEQIVGVDFSPAPAGRLDDLERRTIQRLELEGERLVNSALVGLPMGEGPLDLVVERVEQEGWLSGCVEEAYDLEARIVEAERARCGEKFHELAARDDYQDLRLLLLLYLVRVVPWPHETERRFWSASSLPATKQSATHRRLCTVSVNNVETLVIAEVLHEGEWLIAGLLNVAPGTATGHQGNVLRRTYRTIGAVDSVHFDGLDDLGGLLNDPDVVAGARRTALGLMRKGRGMMARFHDTSLADDVFMLSRELADMDA